MTAPAPEWMHTRLIKQNAYTPEDITGIAKRCDWFLFRNQLIRKKTVPQTVFIVARFGEYPIYCFVKELLPTLTEPIVLIIASEDHTFPSGSGDARHKEYTRIQPQIQTLLTHPMVLRIFVENLDTLHPRLTPIPLGILHYACAVPNFAPAASLDSRPFRVFCCHRVREGPQWDDRKRVSEYCTKDWKSFCYFRPTLENFAFSQALAASKFCICVHGGGLDPSPRVWEALLAGCIPIVEHSTLDEAYGRFPIAYVDAWTPDAVTPEKLDNWLTELRPHYEDPEKRARVMEMLTMDYWWNIITAPLKIDAPVSAT